MARPLLPQRFISDSNKTFKVWKQQIEGVPQNFIQLWPNLRTFKASKMKKMFSKIIKHVGALVRDAKLKNMNYS